MRFVLKWPFFSSIAILGILDFFSVSNYNCCAENCATSCEHFVCFVFRDGSLSLFSYLKTVCPLTNARVAFRSHLGTPVCLLKEKLKNVRESTRPIDVAVWSKTLSTPQYEMWAWISAHIWTSLNVTLYMEFTWALQYLYAKFQHVVPRRPILK